MSQEVKKLFIGGLSWETSPEDLSKYFSKYGEVIDCAVMKNPETGRSRGFGFVTFADPSCVQLVLSSGPHSLDGRTIDPKCCNAKGAQKVKKEAKSVNYPKVFLGGLPSNINETLLREFFSKYGTVVDVIIMYDQEKKKSRGNGFRGFGFLSFESDETVNNLVSEQYVTINGKKVEVKRAEPRDKLPGSSIDESSTSSHSASFPSNNSSIIPGLGSVTNPAIGASYPWWAQVPGAAALVTPSGFVPSAAQTAQFSGTTLISPAQLPSAAQTAQFSGTTLISPTQFPSNVPWGAVSIPTLAGWNPSNGHPSSTPLPGFSVWPSAFNAIGAQAALASVAAAQSYGTLGNPNGVFPTTYNIGPNYGQTAASATVSTSTASPVPGSVATAVPTSVSMNGNPSSGGVPFAQDASHFGPTRIYGYGFPSASSLLQQLQTSPSNITDGSGGASSSSSSATSFNTNLIPATTGVLRTCSQLQGFHPYRRV